MIVRSNAAIADVHEDPVTVSLSSLLILSQAACAAGPPPDRHRA
jgi:hypothetical protein